MKNKHAQHAANVRWDKHRKNMKELDELRDEVGKLREFEGTYYSSIRKLCDLRDEFYPNEKILFYVARDLSSDLHQLKKRAENEKQERDAWHKEAMKLESENAQLKAEQKITVQIGSALLAIVAVGISVLVWQIVKGQPLF
jgi:uncharacterized protein YhaN